MEYKLKECIEKIIDNRGKNPHYYTKEKYPVIDNVLIKNTLYPNMNEVSRYIDKETYDDFLRGHLEKDIPIMTLVGSGIGNVSLAPSENVAIVQNTIGFKPKKEILNGTYLYYWFLIKQNELLKFNRGSGQPSIKKTDIEEMKINLPNIKIQNKVVKILLCIDKKIELNNQINNNLHELGLTLIKKYINQANNLIELNRVINFIKGKKPAVISEKKIENNKKYLTIACLNGQEMNYANTDKMIISNNDLLMVMDGASSGDIYYSDSGVVGSTLAKVDILDDNYGKGYIYFFIKRYANLIKSKNTGSAIPHTDKIFVGNLLILEIDINKQKKFDILLNKIQQMQKENEMLIKLRDTLLPKLMNGEIDLEKIKI